MRGHTWAAATSQLQPVPLVLATQTLISQSCEEDRALGQAGKSWGGGEWSLEKESLNWESAGIGRQTPEGRVRTRCPKRSDRRGSLGWAISWCWGCNKRPESRSFCMKRLGVQEAVKKQQKTGSLSAHSSPFKWSMCRKYLPRYYSSSFPGETPSQGSSRKTLPGVFLVFLNLKSSFGKILTEICSTRTEILFCPMYQNVLSI